LAQVLQERRLGSTGGTPIGVKYHGNGLAGCPCGIELSLIEGDFGREGEGGKQNQPQGRCRGDQFFHVFSNA
jgi:hypothetical protein